MKGDLLCPMFNEYCPYCSIVTQGRAYTAVKKNTITGLYDPAGIGMHIVSTGAFCNNDGKQLVQDMHYCPRRWALHRGMTKNAEKKPRKKAATKEKPPNKPARSRANKGKKAVKPKTTRIAKTAKPKKKRASIKKGR